MRAPRGDATGRTITSPGGCGERGGRDGGDGDEDGGETHGEYEREYERGEGTGPEGWNAMEVRTGELQTKEPEQRWEVLLYGAWRGARAARSVVEPDRHRTERCTDAGILAAIKAHD